METKIIKKQRLWIDYSTSSIIPSDEIISQWLSDELRYNEIELDVEINSSNLNSYLEFIYNYFFYKYFLPFSQNEVNSKDLISAYNRSINAIINYATSLCFNEEDIESVLGRFVAVREGLISNNTSLKRSDFVTVGKRVLYKIY